LNLELTEEQKLLQKSVREFAEVEVKPHAKEIDETHRFPRDTFQKAAELGLSGIAVPENYGGAGMDHICYSIVIEEISRVCASTGTILSVQNSLFCDPILRFGNEEQKQKFLVPFARGEKIGCYALTEPQAGSNAAALTTKAVLKGDRYIVNGTKAGSPMAAPPTQPLFTSTRIPKKARRELRRWSSRKARKDSPSAKKKKSSA